MGGVVSIDKPAGMTSHDVVMQVRRIFRTRKVGHTGTLDPFATGVLVLCLEEATRLVEYLINGEKEYVATMRLGITTDTQDCTGKAVETQSVPEISQADMTRTFSHFVGTIAQVPPMYSAKKVAGRRLYTLARRGHTVKRSARQVTIHALNILDINLPDIRFTMTCSAGTYVRTLAHDLGEALGCGAHLTALTRTRSGTFSLENALSLDHLSDMDEGELTHVLTPGDQAVTFFPAVTIDDDLAEKLIHGLRIPVSGVSAEVLNISVVGNTMAEHLCRVYRDTDDFIAIARWIPAESEGNSENLLQPRKVFV